MKIENQKWFKHEARLLTEIARSLIPDDFDNIKKNVLEHYSFLKRPKRIELIDYIAEKYNLKIDILTHEIKIDGRFIRIYEYYPTKFAGTQSLKDFGDMESECFRNKVAEILCAFPGAVEDFNLLAEEVPYIY